MRTWVHVTTDTLNPQKTLRTRKVRKNTMERAQQTAGAVAAAAAAAAASTAFLRVV